MNCRVTGLAIAVARIVHVVKRGNARVTFETQETHIAANKKLGVGRSVRCVAGRTSRLAPGSMGKDERPRLLGMAVGASSVTRNQRGPRRAPVAMYRVAVQAVERLTPVTMGEWQVETAGYRTVAA